MQILKTMGLVNKTTEIALKSQAVDNRKRTSITAPVAAKREWRRNEELVSREFLITLASDYKNGLIDQAEANSRFVSTVVHNALNDKLDEQDKEKLIADISEFFAQDENFLNELTKNLITLA